MMKEACKCVDSDDDTSAHATFQRMTMSKKVSKDFTLKHVGTMKRVPETAKSESKIGDAH